MYRDIHEQALSYNVVPRIKEVGCRPCTTKIVLSGVNVSGHLAFDKYIPISSILFTQDFLQDIYKQCAPAVYTV